MQTKVYMADLTAAMLAAKATSRNSSMPILECVLLRASEKHLTLKGTDLNQGIAVTISGSTSADWAIAIPAKRLAEAVDKIAGAGDVATLSMEPTTQRLTLKVGTSSVTFTGLDAEDMPVLPSPESMLERKAKHGDTVTDMAIPSDVLVRLVDGVIMAASSDASRPTLTGIETIYKDGSLQMVATDGYRLGYQKAAVDGLNGEGSAIIPAQFLESFSRIAKKMGSRRAEVLLSPNAIVIALESDDEIKRVELSAQLIDARFPDWRSIVPKAHTLRVKARVADLKRETQLAALFAKETAEIVRMEFIPNEADPDRGTIRIRAKAVESGESDATVVARVEGEGVEIAMNAKYLLAYLSTVPSETVMMDATQPTRPMLFWHSDDPAGNYYVLMPMHPPR